MIGDVRVELGLKRHRSELERFQCCAPHLPIVGKRTDQCLEPWAHRIQTDIHRELLPRAGARKRSHDYRLLLLFDGAVLAAVAGHQQHSEGDVAVRYIDLIAVSTGLRGRKLSNGQRCSEAALGMVLDDIRTRTPAVTAVVSEVDCQNELSIRFLSRVGGRIGDDIVDGLRPVVLVPWSPADS